MYFIFSISIFDNKGLYGGVPISDSVTGVEKLISTVTVLGSIYE